MAEFPWNWPSRGPACAWSASKCKTWSWFLWHKIWNHPKDCWLEFVWFIWFIKSSPYSLAVSKWGPSNSTEMVDFDARQRIVLKGSWIPLLYADLYCIYMRSWQELESPIPSKHGMEKTCLRCPRIGVVTVSSSSFGWSCLRNCASFIYQYICLEMLAVAEWGKPKKILHCQCVEDCQSFVGFRTLGDGVQYMTMLEFQKETDWSSVEQHYIYLLN